MYTLVEHSETLRLRERNMLCHEPEIRFFIKSLHVTP